MKKLMIYMALGIVYGLGNFQGMYASTVDYTYSISPLKKTDNNGFNICIGFQATAGESVFDFPLVWGDGNIAEYIRLDTVTGAAGYETQPGAPQKLKIRHNKGSYVKIFYKIHNAVGGETFVGGDVFFPLIHGDHFYFFSNSVMLVPETESLCNFYMEWVDYPPGYAHSPVTSIGSGYKQEMKSVKPLDFQNLVICGGDFRTYERKPGKKETIQLVIRGKWDFADTSMLGMITHTISHQRSFWKDHSTPGYLVVMVPVVAASEHDISFQGTGLLNSFTVAVTENKNAQVPTLGYLFHHELMHHWIGNKIQNGKDEELSYWFSEGFTDYFARMNMYDCGLMNKKEYVRTLDSLFSVHYSDPLRQSHNDSIKVHFWDDRMYGKLPYDRGALFAYYVDLMIQGKTKGKQSLKNVMQDMLKQALKKPQPFDTVWFTRVVKEVCGENISGEIKRFMVNGEFIPVEMWNAVSPGLLEVTEVKIYDLGFEVNTGKIMKGSIITRVKPGTGAELAGLKEGDILDGFSIYYGRPEYEAALNIIRNGAAMKLSFYPFATCRVPQHVKQ